ncbi:MAG: RNA polymerase sigma factor FliA [Zoogloeaceae bacterium]|jgi:RNA polymerase sigma factor for flagellar operon FliA|nr:RNA polymerase sigma factor FliA [Zoogloeaceae bacterium]
MYTADGQIDREQIVEQYGTLVKRLAYHMLGRLPANVDVNDLVQNGMIGLLDACARYRENAGAQFETYAVQRIRGAMLDGLRSNDWLPRKVRQSIRQAESAARQLEHQSGRPPSESELAEALRMPLEEYQRLLQDARGHQLLYLEDFEGQEGDGGFLDRHLGNSENDPGVILENMDLRKNLVQAIARLPEREQLLMSLYYEEELNLREISEVLNISESRVSQLHSQIIVRLRACLLGPEKSGGRREKRA